MLNRKTWNFAAIVVDKTRVNPAIYDPMRFYPKFAGMVVRFVFKGRVRPGTAQVLIYFDALPLSSKIGTQAVEVAFKKSCRNDLPNGLPFQIFNHRRKSNAWIR